MIMGCISHVCSVIVILLFSLVFYFNYRFYNNVSYRIASSALINNYNYACVKYQGKPFYVAVNSLSIIDNATTNGDVVEGRIERTPVVASLSTVAISNVDYMQFTRVYATEDCNGLIMHTCQILTFRQYSLLDVIDNLVVVIVLLFVLLIYVLFVQKWLCLGCSTSGYGELN